MEATFDSAESIISDILISESCVENIISKLDSYETSASEKKYEQPQPLTMVNQTPEKKYDQIQLLSMMIPQKKLGRPIYQGKEPVDQIPPSPRCSIKVIEDYEQEKRFNQVFKDMGIEEATLDEAESILSDVLISECCGENIITKFDSYEMPTFKEKCDQPQPLTMVNQTTERNYDQLQSSVMIQHQKPDQPIHQNKEPVEQIPPSSGCSVKVVEDSLNPTQDSTQSTLPPIDSQQSSSGFPQSLRYSFKQDFPVSGDKIKKPLNFQKTTKQMSGPSMMRQIKIIHNRLNLSLKKSKVLNEADHVLVDKAKQMLSSLKQQQAVLCDSLRDNFKQQTPSNKSRKALKKRIYLLQKQQHKVLLLFQEHNAITKKIKTLKSDNRKQIPKEVERHSQPSNQMTDLSLLKTTKDKISNKIVTSFDDTQSESASTVYSLNSFAWSQKIKPKSPNFPVCEFNIPPRTPLLNDKSILCLSWLNENPTNISNDFSPNAIPSTNISNDFSHNTIPSTNISNDFSHNTIPSTNMSNELYIMPSAIPTINIEPSSTPLTNMSNELFHKPSAPLSTNMSKDFSLNTIPSTGISNDFSHKPSAIPSTNMSNDLYTNMLNNFYPKPFSIPLTNITNDSSFTPLPPKKQKKKSKPPNSLFCEPKLNTWTGMKADHNSSTLSQSQEPTDESSKIPDEKINPSINDFPHHSYVAINSEPNQTPLPNNESSHCPNWFNENSTNISKPLPKTYCQQSAAIPPTNVSNDSSFKPLPKMLPNCQQFTAIPIGTMADFPHGQFVETISHTQQSFDNQLVPNSFLSVLTSAHQGVQNSEMVRHESQNIRANSSDDLLCTSTNISTMTANQAGSFTLSEMKDSHKKISDLKSKHFSTEENNSDVSSTKDRADFDDTNSQIDTSLTHLTLIDDQELISLNSILPSCLSTDSLGSINFPKFLWDGFHLWP